MSASNGGLTISGQQRDLVIQAAMTYDEMQKRIASLENQGGILKMRNAYSIP